jgi:hypothetical protein
MGADEIGIFRRVVLPLWFSDICLLYFYAKGTIIIDVHASPHPAYPYGRPEIRYKLPCRQYTGR